MVHPALDRSHRHGEQRRDFVVLECRHVPEHEHQALRGGQILQDTVNPAHGVPSPGIDGGPARFPAGRFRIDSAKDANQFHVGRNPA